MPHSSYPTKSTSQTKHAKELTRILNNLLKIRVLVDTGNNADASPKLWDTICRLEREVKRATKGGFTK